MKTFLIALFGAIMMLFSLSSCTDQYDVDIVYKTNVTITVTAAHIFDSFQAVEENDFKLSEDPGWELELTLLMYDESGILVFEESENSNSLNTRLEKNIIFDYYGLPSGKYKVISIARFRDGNYFWELLKPEKLSTFIIRNRSRSYYMPSAFETLGIDVRDITIGNKSFMLDIEVPPVTSLVQVFFHGQDLTGFGENGYSEMAPYCQEVNILAPRLMQEVKFTDGAISYDYDIDKTKNPIATFTPQRYFVEGTNASVYNYRALLPIQDGNFYWNVTFSTGTGKKFGLSDSQVIDYTTRLNIESGKQYDLDLLFDYKYLYLQKHVPDEDVTSKLERLTDELNTSIFNQFVEWNFDTFVGVYKDVVEETFGVGYIKGHSICYFNFDSYISELRFNMDESMNTVETVYIQCQHLTGDFKTRLIDYLTNRFTAYKKETEGDIKTFINANSIDSATIKIVWNMKMNLLTYSKIN